MKRKLAVLGFALLCTAFAMFPDRATALVCSPVQQTALFTVGGSTCNQARNDLYGDLTNDAGCSSGFCSAQFIYQPCQVIPGGYNVSGYLRYSCVIDAE